MDAKKRAHMAVHEAVRAGTLQPVTTRPCAGCGAGSAVHYHHANGYDEAHRLDVVPYCGPCHRAQHPAPNTGRTFPDRRIGRILAALSFWRGQRALSQADLAQAAGVSPTTISNLEGGTHRAYPKTVRKLAAALGVEPAALYGEEGA